jgi:hypothetical protein
VLFCFYFKIPIFILGALSLVMMGYTVYLNRSMFASDYINQKAPSFLSDHASLIITAFVILMALLYILQLQGLSSFVSNWKMLGFDYSFGGTKSEVYDNRRNNIIRDLKYRV